MYENEREIQKSLEQSADMHDRPKWSECHTYNFARYKIGLTHALTKNCSKNIWQLVNFSLCKITVLVKVAPLKLLCLSSSFLK